MGEQEEACSGHWNRNRKVGGFDSRGVHSRMLVSRVDFVDRCLLKRTRPPNVNWTRFAWSQPDSIPVDRRLIIPRMALIVITSRLVTTAAPFQTNDNRPSDRRPIIASTSTWWCTDIWLSLGAIYASRARVLWLSHYRPIVTIGYKYFQGIFLRTWIWTRKLI